MRRTFAALAAAVLGGCAQVPQVPTPAPDTARAPRVDIIVVDSSARRAAIARHGELARAARESGDLRLAAEHY